MKIIKLKDLLREQQAQPTVIKVNTNTTPEQLAQQFGDIAPGTTITLDFNMGKYIPDNEAPSQDLIDTVAEKLRMIDNFISDGTIRVIAHASNKPATMKKDGRPGRVEQPAVLRALTKTTSLGGKSISPLTADQFEANGNSTPATRGKGNTNLAVNRAALLGTAITKSGVSLQKYDIAYDVEINKNDTWVAIEITGTFKKPIEEEPEFVQYITVSNILGLAGSFRGTKASTLKSLIDKYPSTSFASIDASTEFKSKIPNPSVLSPITKPPKKVSLEKKTLPIIMQAFGVDTPEELFIKLGAIPDKNS